MKQALFIVAALLLPITAEAQTPPPTRSEMQATLNEVGVQLQAKLALQAQVLDLQAQVVDLQKQIA